MNDLTVPGAMADGGGPGRIGPERVVADRIGAGGSVQREAAGSGGGQRGRWRTVARAFGPIQPSGFEGRNSLNKGASANRAASSCRSGSVLGVIKSV